MYTLLSTVQAASTSDDGLTASEVLAQLPADPATLFTLALLLVTYAGIFWVGRKRKAATHRGPDA